MLIATKRNWHDLYKGPLRSKHQTQRGNTLLINDERSLSNSNEGFLSRGTYENEYDFRVGRGNYISTGCAFNESIAF